MYNVFYCLCCYRKDKYVNYMIDLFIYCYFNLIKLKILEYLGLLGRYIE